MKRLFIFLLIGFSINTYSQEIESENWITDLNFLKTELPKKHKNLFHKLTKQEFENGIENIKNQLDEDTDIETSIKLNQLISQIGDSHTYLSTSHILKKRKSIPLGLMWFKNGLYVSGTTKDNYEILDKKLISINGFKVDRIIDSLKTLFVHENIAEINKNTPRLLKGKVLLKYFGFSKPNDSIYTLELINSKGELTNYKLEETDNSTRNNRNKIYMKVSNEKPFYMNGSRKVFKEKYYPKEKIYFVQYNKCVSKETIEKYGNKEFAYKYPSFKEFETKVLETLRNEDIDKLIFDMRFNQGGSSYLAENLIKQISENKNINKKGKLFVAVGNKTFSSAIFNTVDFIENTNATIIGEKTGGKPNHYGNIKTFLLPYSGIKVTYSSEFYKLNDKNESTITPEVLIERTHEDYKNGVDPIFEYVKKQ